MGVKELLKDQRVNPSAQNNSALISAASNGHLEVVKVLLRNDKLNISNKGNSILFIYSVTIFWFTFFSALGMITFLACENGHTTVVEELLKDERLEISSTLSAQLFYIAVSKQNNSMILSLLKDKRLDPSVNNNRLIQYASEKNLIGNTKFPVGVTNILRYR